MNKFSNWRDRGKAAWAAVRGRAHQREIISLIGQLIVRALPEQSLQRIDFDRAKNRVTVFTSEGEHRLSYPKESIK